MAQVLIERRCALSADEAWRRVTAWERHADLVPLTRITVTTPPPTSIGTVFVAHTGVGPAGFDDPMEVVLWEPPAAGRPGRCRLEKRGSVMLGWAEIEVAPTGSGSLVRWREDIRVRRVPAALDPVTRWSARAVFGRALAGLLRA